MARGSPGYSDRRPDKCMISVRETRAPWSVIDPGRLQELDRAGNARSRRVLCCDLQAKVVLRQLVEAAHICLATAGKCLPPAG